MNSDLKPCPFCGGEAVKYLYSGSPCVGCKDCIAYLGGEESSLTYEQLAEAWNRRNDASLADAQAEIARLRGAFSNLLEMVEQHADFANGVTDPTGTIDEGRVIAAEQLRKFQEVLK